MAASLTVSPQEQQSHRYLLGLGSAAFLALLTGCGPNPVRQQQVAGGGGGEVTRSEGPERVEAKKLLGMLKPAREVSKVLTLVEVDITRTASGFSEGGLEYFKSRPNERTAFQKSLAEASRALDNAANDEAMKPAKENLLTVSQELKDLATKLSTEDSTKKIFDGDEKQIVKSLETAGAKARELRVNFEVQTDATAPVVVHTFAREISDVTKATLEVVKESGAEELKAHTEETAALRKLYSEAVQELTFLLVTPSLKESKDAISGAIGALQKVLSLTEEGRLVDAFKDKDASDGAKALADVSAKIAEIEKIAKSKVESGPLAKHVQTDQHGHMTFVPSVHRDSSSSFFTNMLLLHWVMSSSSRSYHVTPSFNSPSYRGGFGAATSRSATGSGGGAKGGSGTTPKPPSASGGASATPKPASGGGGFGGSRPGGSSGGGRPAGGSAGG